MATNSPLAIERSTPLSTSSSTSPMRKVLRIPVARSTPRPLGATAEANGAGLVVALLKADRLHRVHPGGADGLDDPDVARLLDHNHVEDAEDQEDRDDADHAEQERHQRLFLLDGGDEHGVGFFPRLDRDRKVRWQLMAIDDLPHDTLHL